MIITMLAMCYLSYGVRIVKDGILWIRDSYGNYDLCDALVTVCCVMKIGIVSVPELFSLVKKLLS